ncbi:MAG: hypothetical protein OXC14_14960 [Rhodospirillaceae bacterium]|nr:hypothetical protein [Rhodospirillaceae bacterium]
MTAQEQTNSKGYAGYFLRGMPAEDPELTREVLSAVQSGKASTGSERQEHIRKRIWALGATDARAS